jgi:GT2 family glycosyltransferase
MKHHPTIAHSEQPQLSIIVVSFNTCRILQKCLQKLDEETQGLRTEVIVVDNHSKDQSADMVAQEFPQFTLVRSQVNLGFAAANNVGFARAQGRYIILLNPDAFLTPGALQASYEQMEEMPKVGIAGGRLEDQQGQLQPSGRMFPSLLNELLVLSGLAARFPMSRLFGRFDRTWADPNTAAKVDWVPGAFTIIRREAINSHQLFDERFFLYYEEVDLCRRVTNTGYEIWYLPSIRVVHLGGESSKTVVTEQFSKAGSQLTLWRMRSELLYYRKHHGALTVWLCAHLEMMWNQLRLLRRRHKNDNGQSNELLNNIQLMKRAWNDTKGGSLSPQRPW